LRVGGVKGTVTAWIAGYNRIVWFAIRRKTDMFTPVGFSGCFDATGSLMRTGR
jgi:hypothetical protein